MGTHGCQLVNGAEPGAGHFSVDREGQKMVRPQRVQGFVDRAAISGNDSVTKRPGGRRNRAGGGDRIRGRGQGLPTMNFN
jgi:hypothetical protein